MKKFNYHLTIFIIFLFLYFGIITVANFFIFESLKIPIETSQIFIAGDSHPQRSLDPTKLNSAVNISQSAEPYILTYWKLKYLFKYFKPQILILGFSHHNISAFNDRKFWDKDWSSEMFKRSYIIGEYCSLKGIKIDYKEYFNIYFKQMCLYPQFRHIEFIGGYVNENNSNLSDVKKAIKRHYYYRNNELGPSNISILYLDHIINLCKKNNIIPILIGSPVHQDYFKLIPNSIKEKYNSEKIRFSKKNIKVLDFTTENYDDTLFLNADHLNIKGAAHFTRKVSSILRNLEKKMLSKKDNTDS